MVMTLKSTPQSPRRHRGLGTMTLTLPGTDRKRTPATYRYRVTYRSPRPDQPGCVMTWAVQGGRSGYQIALERQDAGTLAWHCSCADAGYRGEDDPRHECKHVLALRECFPFTA